MVEALVVVVHPVVAQQQHHDGNADEAEFVEQQVGCSVPCREGTKAPEACCERPNRQQAEHKHAVQAIDGADAFQGEGFTKDEQVWKQGQHQQRTGAAEPRSTYRLD